MRTFTLLAVPALIAITAARVAAVEPPILNPQALTQALFSTAMPLAPEQKAARSSQASDDTLIHVVLPAVPGADAQDVFQGFVRVVNRAEQRGEVTIHAVDDAGERFGPITLPMGPWQARHFNSGDLENGNPAKGLSGGVGDGTGWWRVEMSTTLRSFRAASYIRTPDGFVTSMHLPALQTESPSGIPRYLLHIFNPARNTQVQSWLRIINPNGESVAVLVGAMDDTGHLAGPITFPLLAREAVQLSAQQLEEGAPSIPLWEGRLGSGTGKWEIFVVGHGIYGGYLPLQVMSLLSTATGHLTNVTR